MNHVPLTGPSVGGYDVSHWQSNFHIHEEMRAAGKKFCLIKADEGARIVDDKFKAHYTVAKAAGMRVGFYNFFHPAQNADAQAKHILSLIGGMQDDLGVCCDLETKDGLSSAVTSGAAYQFLSEVKAAIGKVILYGGPYFLEDTAKIDERFKEFPLWIAHYGPKPERGPLVPPPYDAWALWQYSESNGIDLNLFNGDEKALAAFCART